MNREGKIVADNEGIDLKHLCRNCGSANVNDHPKLDNIAYSHSRPILDIVAVGWLTCNNCGHSFYAGVDNEDIKRN